jgi:16S rRNA (guanine966-N2)-methyltransferase
MVNHTGNKNSPAGRLRIVAGNWRSRLLDIADVPGLRPTSTRIRETLFNWLAPGLPGARCLDLCAGTGALGLEALSRGAASAVFVERSVIATRMLRANIATLQATSAEVLQMDALDFSQAQASAPFDLVFLDPPFAADMLNDLCRLLSDRKLLASNARIYLEQDRDRPEPELPEGWQVLKNKTAGNVRYMLVTPDD